jgi:hypothetical protein
MAQCCQSVMDTLMDTCWEQAVKQSTFTNRADNTKYLVGAGSYLVNVLLLLLWAGRLNAVPGQVVVGGHGLIGVVAGLHAQEPGLVLQALGLPLELLQLGPLLLILQPRPVEQRLASH